MFSSVQGRKNMNKKNIVQVELESKDFEKFTDIASSLGLSPDEFLSFLIRRQSAILGEKLENEKMFQDIAAMKVVLNTMKSSN